MYSQKICYLIDSKSFEGDENEERRRGDLALRVRWGLESEAQLEAAQAC